MNVPRSSLLLDEVERKVGVPDLAVGEYHDLEGKVLDGRENLCSAKSACIESTCFRALCECIGGI
jgi:hypothetical protein